MAKKTDDKVRIQVFVSRATHEKLVSRVAKTNKINPGRVSMSSYCCHVLEQHVAPKKKGR